MVSEQYEPFIPPDSRHQHNSKEPDIRTRLRQWQELNRDKEGEFRLEPAFEEAGMASDIVNSTSRMSENISAGRSSEAEHDEEQQVQAHFMTTSFDNADATFDTRPLRMGDLVELERLVEDRESVLAVYVQRCNASHSQFLTMTGRWIYAKERFIPYSIPGWVSPTLVEPLLEHLPDPKESLERNVLMDSNADDMLSLPRQLTAPLVTKMVRFWTESQEVYRQHASRLDNAHDELAHPTDLRYGSLLSVAQRLFDRPASKISAPALYAVRTALSRADFAFSIDRRSHRLTGYLQIRSKDQVQMVTEVRDWIREWQEDRAQKTALLHQDGRKQSTSSGAQTVYSFITKATEIIKKSREDRVPTPSGFLSPSKHRFAITDTQECVKHIKGFQFTEKESQIVRFMEGWACNQMFTGLPRLLSLPPLLLHATGMYTETQMSREHMMQTGWQFLQELGTLVPYENRIRSDSQLLLPTSQHSKPLQKLMSDVIEMEAKPDFTDSMKGLREDVGGTAYCIDDASAQEIDDGISIERAGLNLWWVHVHVANPTAFMDREHLIAKMARHMGESLYMPERTYAMLPRWATTKYFSLASNRPCLTFSMKMDGEGRILEHEIRPGKLLNAVKLTRAEVEEAMGMETEKTLPRHTLIVGGDPPPEKPRKSALPKLSLEQVQDLKTLHMLASKRAAQRVSNGGVIFDTKQPEMQVWQSAQRPGLSWDHPHRKGSRTTLGDPVIKMQTQGLVTSFDRSVTPAALLVMEMMLAAGDTAGRWCAERQIPALFRGTVRAPGSADPEIFRREVFEPSAEKYGAPPMHLALEYLSRVGAGAMRTKPIRHRILGMESFCKTTSPLRRYGDMILHWQIEAALREEARTGKSLKTDNPRVDRSFLPFSSTILETIMLGLAPREAMISRAKHHASRFWEAMLVFRAISYDECELPFATPLHPNKPNMRVWCTNDPNNFAQTVPSLEMSLGLAVTMLAPETLGMPMARRGDVWEVQAEMAMVQHKAILAKPVRLLERPDD